MLPVYAGMFGVILSGLRLKKFVDEVKRTGLGDFRCAPAVEEERWTETDRDKSKEADGLEES